MSVSIQGDFGIIKQNLEGIREEIAQTSKGRDVTLVCVTKYVDAGIASMLVSAGAEHLGENRIVEGIRKFDDVRSEGAEFTAHMIGRIQSNKAPKIPGKFEWCQSVASVKVADILQRKCADLDVSLECAIEVNIGVEEQKGGVAPDALRPLVEHILSDCPALHLRGLMCLPPIAEESETRRYFSRMRILFEGIRDEYSDSLGKWDALSMGMSADFRWAIEEGATIIRVGSLLYRGISGFV
ncbi:YggS family pyridoxal phosphate-dependent enzyme [bacterium]|nr:YggS family pyridoxal phosphate-dependent enzyme [bacterium]